MVSYKMWEKTPLAGEEEPVLEYYPAERKKTDAVAVIFPGGGYRRRAGHEGNGYAGYLNSIGMDAFVCEYRVHPDLFPAPLLDARRAVRFVRANAEKFDLSPDKIAVMGSSAGGHLAALVSTYFDPIDGEGIDETDNVNCKPNATILCYPVVHMPDEENIGHVDSYRALLGEGADCAPYSPDLLVDDSTPSAFIWHVSEDSAVNVANSYKYAAALARHGIPHELHVFPYGVHGMGLALQSKHVAQWTGLLHGWFCEIGWLSD